MKTETEVKTKTKTDAEVKTKTEAKTKTELKINTEAEVKTKIKPEVKPKIRVSKFREEDVDGPNEVMSPNMSLLVLGHPGTSPIEDEGKKKEKKKKEQKKEKKAKKEKKEGIIAKAMKNLSSRFSGS